MRWSLLRAVLWWLAIAIAIAFGHPACAQEDFLRFQGLVSESLGEENFRVAARLRPPEGAAGARTPVEITFSCAPEHYVWHDSVRITLADTGGADIAAGQLSLPEPKEKDDPFAGGTVKYLDGTFSATLELDIGAQVEPGDYDLELDVRYTGCGPGICQFARHRVAVRLTVLPAGAPVPRVTAEVAPAQLPEARPAPPAAEGDAYAGKLAGRSPIVAVLIAFLAGLGLAFTPCVYPLIPITVSLVGATSGRGKLDGLVRSLVYVFGIAVTYSVVGVVAAATGGVFGAWVQHPAVYVALAVIFVLLAGAMFGLYSIDVSSQRLQRLQAGLLGRGGLVGIWVIGVLSGAAATACIAPIIIGTLGYVAQRGSLLLGFLIFFALAWGMGTPLIVLGTFTGLAKALPKSGQWMVAVKHVFGLALLGVAVYFVGKSRLLPEAWYRVFVGVSLLAAAAAVAVYRPWPRSVLPAVPRALVVVALLLVPIGMIFYPTSPTEATGQEVIEWLHSEQGALKLARGRAKPVLLDFWADWCAPCELMLKTTFADPRVVAESRRFVCAKIDVSDPDDPEIEELLRKYDVRGVPTTILITSGGERHSFTGYLGPDAMLPLMQSIP